MWPNSQESADLFTFKEILNEKLHFLCSAGWYIPHPYALIVYVKANVFDIDFEHVSSQLFYMSVM